MTDETDYTNNEMTWRELAATIFPDKGKDFLDNVLWNHTAFPFAPPDHIVKQLRVWKAMKEEPKGVRWTYDALSMGGTQEDVADHFDCSRRTVQRWQKRANDILVAEGLEPFTTRRRRYVSAPTDAVKTVVTRAANGQ